MVQRLFDGILNFIRYKTKKTCTVLQPIKQNKGNKVGLVFDKSLVVINKELLITKNHVFEVQSKLQLRPPLLSDQLSKIPKRFQAKSLFTTTFRT